MVPTDAQSVEAQQQFLGNFSVVLYHLQSVNELNIFQRSYTFRYL